MKRLLPALFLAGFLVPFPLSGFGPVSVVRAGLFRSNAAGLPLSEISPAAGDDPGGYILEVRADSGGSEERLLRDGAVLAVRTITREGSKRVIEETRGDRTVYRAVAGPEGLLSESGAEGDTAYRYADGVLSAVGEDEYRFSRSGDLALVTSGGRYLLFSGPERVYEEREGTASLFSSTPDGRQQYRMWEKEKLARTGTVKELEDGWLEERISVSGKGEEIRVYDAANRLRSVRGRGEEAFFVASWDYSGGVLTKADYRSAGLEETSRYSYEGELPAEVSTWRNGVLVQKIRAAEQGYIVYRYRDGREIAERPVDGSTLRRHLESFRTLDPSVF